MDTGLDDRQVARALRGVAAGRVSAMGDLVELLGDSVYRLSKAVTGDAVVAEDAAVETFRQIWQHVPSELPERAAVAWALHLACEVACERARGLRLAPAEPNGGTLSQVGHS